MRKWIAKIVGWFKRDPDKIDIPKDWPYDHYDRPVGFPPRSKPSDYEKKD